MQITRLAPSWAIVLLSLTACGEAASPSAGAPTAPPAPAGPAVVRILGWAEILRGEEYTFTSRVTTAKGAPLIGTPIDFRSNDPTIAVIESVSPSGDGFQVRVRGVGAGTTALTATALGRTTSARIKVLALVSGPSSVVIEDFRVTEYRPSPLGDYTAYVPYLRVRDTAGNTGAAVIRTTFTITPPASALSCTMLRPIAGAPYELFAELYGDSELTLPLGGNGRVLAGEMVTVHVTVRLDDTTATVLTATAPIVAGSPPASVPSSVITGSATDIDCR